MLSYIADKLRNLKGAAVSVLVLLSNAPEPVSKAWLQREAGYSDKPIKKACDELERMGWLNHSQEGWCLTPEFLRAMNRGIPSNPPEPEIEPDEEEESGAVGDPTRRFTVQLRRKSAPNERTGQNSDSGRLERPLSRPQKSRRNRRNAAAPDSKSKKSDLKQPDNNELKDLKTTTTPITRFKVNSNSSNNASSEKFSDADMEEIREIFSKPAIGFNQRTLAMLALPHVTVDYLRDKVAEYTLRGKGGPEWAGLLIRTIEQNEPALPKGFYGHIQGCTCIQCGVARFFGREEC